jgi:SRSO17 transposase
VLGLLAELPRKNCWTIAEHAGDPSPDGMQHLLARAKRDADAVRDDVRGYVIEQLGDPGAVLVIDETGDVKKGTATPGVQRQYTGTAAAGGGPDQPGLIASQGWSSRTVYD